MSEPNDGLAFDAEAVFDPDWYLYFYDFDDERSAAEADLLDAALDVDAGDRVLDVPCGHGRLSNRLAERGYDLAGLDASDEFLDRARDDAADRGVDVEYVRGDMRGLPWPADEFDAAYNAFTSFGYFDEAGDRETLSELARVVRPGGRVVVETLNRDAVLSDFEDTVVVERDGDYMIDRMEFDPKTGRLTTDRTMIRGGETRAAPFSVRLYNYNELAARLVDAGFDVVETYGDLDGSAFDLDAGRLCVVAERT